MNTIIVSNEIACLRQLSQFRHFEAIMKSQTTEKKGINKIVFA